MQLVPLQPGLHRGAHPRGGKDTNPGDDRRVVRRRARRQPADDRGELQRLARRQQAGMGWGLSTRL
jgi:hypothetical protein